jgi:mannose/fructose/N-acetylgalactosamine-specific phosphotransferase system component IID
MIVIYGFRFMAAHEEEEKIATAKSWLLNVIIALVLIKIIDYVFYIASTPSFTESASQLIIQAAKVLGWILWWAMMWSVVYTGFLLVTSTGDEEKIAKAKNLILTIFLVWVVIFLFLLIIYQIFKEFA